MSKKSRKYLPSFFWSIFWLGTSTVLFFVVNIFPIVLDAFRGHKEQLPWITIKFAEVGIGLGFFNNKVSFFLVFWGLYLVSRYLSSLIRVGNKSATVLLVVYLAVIIWCIKATFLTELLVANGM